MKVNQHIRILIIFFVIINLNGCDIGPEIVVPTPDIKSNDKIISCNNCNDFGKIIELIGDQMIISDFENVFIYVKEDDTWKLTFENTRTNTSGIQAIKVKDSTMLIGIADARGGGIVEIFEFENDSWDLVNTLSVDRREDNFGSALDIYDDKIIIGSNAQWLDGSSNFNEDEGRVYIYESGGDYWKLEAEFEANNSQDDDRFGDAVAIYNDIALAGGRNTEGLHMYRFNGSSWELDSLIDMPGVRVIQHSRNRFLIRKVIGFQPELIALTLNSEGDLIRESINSDFNSEELSDRGEIIQMDDNFALIDFENADYTFLMEYTGNSWEQRTTLTGKQGIFCEYRGLALFGKMAAIGSNNYVFIRDF